MGLLDTGAYKDNYKRTLARASLRCSILEVREIETKQRDDGKPARNVVFIDLKLEQPAKTTDGELVEAGFPVQLSLNYYPATNGDDALVTANRITGERVRQLIVSALDLPVNCKDVPAEVNARGGYSCLKGKEIAVDIDAKDDRQNVNRFFGVAGLALQKH